MDAEALAEHYRGYLRCLDERRFDDLTEFVEDTVIYNGETWTRAQYADMIVADCTAIPDVSFVIDALVVEADTVAARLAFDCTPEHEWHGRRPTGKAIQFVEHVFYDFAPGRIRQVWSLLDERAIAAQMVG